MTPDGESSHDPAEDLTDQTGWGSSTIGDTALVVGITRGRRDALALAYERHATSLHAVAVRLCGPELADAVVHAVFQDLWAEPATYDPDRGSLRVHLVALTHRRAVSFARDGATHDPTSAQPSYALREPTGHPPFSDRPAHGPAALLERLPAAQGQAILLAYFSGYTYREVAQALGQSEAATKQLIRAGLLQLHALIASGPSPVGHAER